MKTIRENIAIYLREDMGTKEYLKLKMDLTEACKREADLVLLNNAAPLLRYGIYKNNIFLFTRDEVIESDFDDIVVDNNMGNPETLGEAFEILNKEKYLSDM